MLGRAIGGDLERLKLRKCMEWDRGWWNGEDIGI